MVEDEIYKLNHTLMANKIIAMAEQMKGDEIQRRLKLDPTADNSLIRSQQFIDEAIAQYTAMREVIQKKV